MTAVLSRIDWASKIVWSPAHEVGVREPFNTLAAEVDDVSLTGYFTDLNAVAYRSGFWKISSYDRGDREVLHQGRERNQHEAVKRATGVLVDLLNGRT